MTMVVNPTLFASAMSYDYAHALGQGDRTATITVSGMTPSSGPLSNAVNGNTTNNSTTGGFNLPLGASNQILEFDFASPVDFDEMTILWSSTASQGTWVIESSPDDSAWTSRKAGFSLGGATTQAISIDTLGTLHRYWRLRQTSGSTIGNRILEVTFRTWG